MKGLSALAACLVLAGGTAQAGVVTVCGESNGQAYFIEGGLVDKINSGWKEDTIKNGEIILFQSENNVKLLFKDAVRTFDQESQGAVVMATHESEDYKIIIVSYGAVLETYMFHLSRDGNGELLWTALKADQPVNAARLFRAVCKAP